jgi:chemotaxis protein CheD
MAKTEIGMRNGPFAQWFLAAEGIPVLGGSLGGKRARRLRFFPADGRVQQRLMSEDSAPPIQTPALELPNGSGELELF